MHERQRQDGEQRVAAAAAAFTDRPTANGNPPSEPTEGAAAELSKPQRLYTALIVSQKYLCI